MDMNWGDRVTIQLTAGVQDQTATSLLMIAKAVNVAKPNPTARGSSSKSVDRRRKRGEPIIQST